MQFPIIIPYGFITCFNYIIIIATCLYTRRIVMPMYAYHALGVARCDMYRRVINLLANYVPPALTLDS